MVDISSDIAAQRLISVLLIDCFHHLNTNGSLLSFIETIWTVWIDFKYQMAMSFPSSLSQKSLNTNLFEISMKR